MEELRFILYGDYKSIPLSEFKNTSHCYARVENSGCEGYYVEVARWNEDINKWQRYAFAKFLGGEIPDCDGLTCATNVVSSLNERWNDESTFDVIHNLDNWKSKPNPFTGEVLEKIKAGMIKHGFVWKDKDNLDGWSDALLDAIQEEFDIETQLRHLFEGK